MTLDNATGAANEKFYLFRGFSVASLLDHAPSAISLTGTASLSLVLSAANPAANIPIIGEFLPANFSWSATATYDLASGVGTYAVDTSHLPTFANLENQLFQRFVAQLEAYNPVPKSIRNFLVTPIQFLGDVSLVELAGMQDAEFLLAPEQFLNSSPDEVEEESGVTIHFGFEDPANIVNFLTGQPVDIFSVTVDSSFDSPTEGIPVIPPTPIFSFMGVINATAELDIVPALGLDFHFTAGLDTAGFYLRKQNESMMSIHGGVTGELIITGELVVIPFAQITVGIGLEASAGIRIDSSRLNDPKVRASDIYRNGKIVTENLIVDFGVDLVLSLEGEVGLIGTNLTVGVETDMTISLYKGTIGGQQPGADAFADFKSRLVNKGKEILCGAAIATVNPVLLGCCGLAYGPQILDALKNAGEYVSEKGKQAIAAGKEAVGKAVNVVHKAEQDARDEAARFDRNVLQPLRKGIVDGLTSLAAPVVDFVNSVLGNDWEEIDIDPEYSYSVQVDNGTLVVTANPNYFSTAELAFAIVDNSFIVSGPSFTRNIHVAKKSDWQGNTEYRNEDVEFSNVYQVSMAGITSIRVIGTSGNDKLTVQGTLLVPVRLEGLGGDDLLTGGDGNDTLVGGSGDDTLIGGAGDDTLDGDGDDDTLLGGSGNNTLRGGAGDDFLSVEDSIELSGREFEVNVFDGGSGDDTLMGGVGVDRMNGGAGRDSLYGGDGDDELTGGPATLPAGSSAAGESDYLDGGMGNDVLVGGVGNNVLIGGEGNDTLTAGHDDSSLDGGAGEDTLTGGAGHDTLIGGAGNDRLYARGGADLLRGGDGDDYLEGGQAATATTPSGGNDLLYGEAGNDTIVSGWGGPSIGVFPTQAGTFNSVLDGGDGNDSLTGGAGPNYMTGGFGNDTLIGGPFDDTLVAYSGVDFLDGGGGNDTLIGSQGNDETGASTLRGGAGSDTIRSGNGPDVISGGDGDDFIYANKSGNVIDGDAGNDTIYGDVGADLIRGGAGNDTIRSGNGPDVVSGGDDDDVIYVTNGDNVIDGDAGNDAIYGGDGADLIRGGTGNDTIRSGLGANVIYGGDGDDTLYANAAGNLIYGDAGNDTIYGAAGVDVIHGGAGNDVITGGGAADVIDGDADNDTIDGGSGNDLVRGGAGDDVLRGNDGDDTLYGGANNDALQGEQGADTLFGEDGDDTLDGGEQNDVLKGEAGNDTLYGAEGDDFLDGGAGQDHLYGDRVTVGADGNDLLRGGDDNDDLHGGGGKDLLKGDAGDDALYGDAGVDELLGGAGNDTLSGGAGDDLLKGEDGADVLAGDADNDVLDGGAGVDVVRGGSGNDTLFGGGGVGDSLFGDDGDDLVYGSDDGADDPNFADGVFFGDVIDGGVGNDRIFGLGGADVISGGAGDDVIDAGANADWVRGGAGNDVITGRNGADRLEGEAGDDTLYGSDDAADTLLGGAGNDRLYGQGGNDVLWGDDGDDLLDGGAGADTLSGGIGDDTLRGGGGIGDALSGEDGDDVLEGSDDGADLLSGGAGRDRISGFGGNDTLGGGAGDDILDGGSGDDVLSGDAGSDLLLGGADHDVLYGHSASASDDDNAVDRLYGDFGTNANEAGSGRDRLSGNGGNDLLFGEGEDDFIGDTGGDLVNYGAGESATPSDFVTPTPTPAPTVQPHSGLAAPGATLSIGTLPRGRWSQLAGSGFGAGVSGDVGASFEPSLVVAPSGALFTAWADSRNGNFEIYVARYQSGVWQELAGSAGLGGVSNTSAASRRPSLTLDASGQPVVAWTESTAAGSNVLVSQYDPALNGGSGGWSLLGTSASGTNGADRVTVVNTSAGVVAAWLDSSSGSPQVYARRFSGGSWQPLGTSASGAGISAAAGGAADLAVATDGTKVAVAWSALVGGVRQAFVREFNGTSWIELAGSGTGFGVSGTPEDSQSPTLAYAGGLLHAAWVTDVNGQGRISAARFNGTAWITAGSVSSAPGDARAPRLASSGSNVTLAWLNDFDNNGLAGSTPSLGGGNAIYVRTWNGASFVEQVAGDASRSGVVPAMVAALQMSLAVSASGQPFVAWADTVSGRPEIYVRGNVTATGTVYYVNDGSSAGDAVATAFGASANSGLSPNAPKASVQQILDAYDLEPGDVILVDAGAYSGFTVASQDAGVQLQSAATATINSPVAINADGVVVQGFTLNGSVTLTGAVDPAVVANTIGGAGLTITGGSGARVVRNRFNNSGLTLTGSTANPTVEQNTFSGGATGLQINGTGATGVAIRSNVFSGATTGILLNGPGTGLLSDNDVAAATTAMRVSADFGGTVRGNQIHGATTGLLYEAAANVTANDIHHNATGVLVTAATMANGLGFVGSGAGNDIRDNTTGVNLTGRMQNQRIRNGSTGVIGSGILGGDSLDAVNVIEANATGVDFTGTIQFNRIARNVVGIQAKTGQIVVHNQIVGNTSRGIEISGKSEVHVVQNTLYSEQGDLVRIAGSSSAVEVRNNVLWAGGGYAIYVANDSQTGFFSDSNTLHSSGTGKLIRWGVDFNDVLDWQADVARFDLHSRGRTAVDPLTAQPRFVDKGRDDYRVFDLVAGGDFTSPTVNRGDAIVDLGQPAATNLLVNPSFESGVTGWATNVGAATQATNPVPFVGSTYFAPGASAAGSAMQTVDLLAAGYSASQLDSQDFDLLAGGRVRFGSNAIAANIVLTFLAGNGTELGAKTFQATPSSASWELVGGRVLIPTGARSVRFAFESTRGSSDSANTAYLDGAFLRMTSRDFVPDQGASGNTAYDLGQSIASRIDLLSPDLYVDAERSRPVAIRWISYANPTHAPVRIDLYQDGAAGPHLLSTIASSTADDGEFAWTPANSNVNFGTYGLRIHVSLVGNAAVYDRSTETFTVPENTTTFYVNDASVVNDEYVSVPGTNRNTGRIASAPKPLPNNVLRTYVLGPTHVLYVDTGVYDLPAPLVLSGIPEYGDDEGFVMTGPVSASRTVAFHHANTTTSTPLIQLIDADFVTMAHLTLENAKMGVWLNTSSTNFVGSYLTTRNNSQDGIRIEGGSSVTRLDHVVSTDNAGYGIYVWGAIDLLTDSTVARNSGDGLFLNFPGAVHVERNVVTRNRIGISVNNYNTSGQAVIGNADVSLGLGNVVSENSSGGISVNSNTLVAGNTVERHTGSNVAGISMSDSIARSNVVDGNFDGISGNGTIESNRVYGNSNIGIRMTYGAVRGNVVYSNFVGMDLGTYNASSADNNLVYANTSVGIRVAGSGSSLRNNTVYQPLGDGIVRCRFPTAATCCGYTSWSRRISRPGRAAST